MKKIKKKVFTIGIILTAIILASYILLRGSSNNDVEFTYGKVSVGDLKVVITSTGTIEANSTVEVGTQVSGIVSKLLVDYNSDVRKGQLLAILDTVNLAAQVRDAQATLEKAEAEYEQKNNIHEKNKKLYEKKYTSEIDYIQSKTDVKSSTASLKSAQTALERAETNLSYAYVHSPISGKIISRSVEQGQTVAASLSAPTLFKIAEDLSSMRILASVDEGDIGQISEGQKVSFTVQTYPKKTFYGVVKQKRLEASTVSNVVNYTVVINAENKEGLLIPGMTATVDFYIEERLQVLTVPNTALRVQPTEQMMIAARKNMEQEMANNSNSSSQINKRPAAPPSGDGNSGKPADMNMIWYQDDKGNIKMCPVKIGITDGKKTEILMSRDLKNGMQIITSIISEVADVSTAKSTNSIISGNTNQQGSMPPPGGGGF